MAFPSPIPRPEYPRPDRQRGRVEGIDWLNLNGPWQFRFDLNRVGLEQAWFAADGPDWREQIIVPFCWESLAAWGEGDAAGNDNYFSRRVYLDPLKVTRENHRGMPRYEVGWYRRRVEIPDGAPWDGRRVYLTVGAADYFLEAWCNGIPLGRYESGYVPVELDLTPALVQSGGRRCALLVFRVEDPMDNHEQPVGKQWGWYTPTSGIWQTVFIEPRGPAYIDHFRTFPDIDAGEVRFELQCAGGSGGGIIDLEVTAPDGPALRREAPVHDHRASIVLPVSPVVLWDPGAPRLYHVTFRLRDGEAPEDTVRGYFGMRKINTAPASEGRSPARLCLNNKPIYLRGALYQSYFPDGVYTARELRTLEQDIAYAHDAGFDFLRVHIKLDDPLLLHCADTIGMLIMQDLPNFGEGGDTPLGRRRFEAMMRRGMQRDFNHPSIIAWCLFNETWGFGGQNELMKHIAPKLSEKLTRQDAEKFANLPSFKWVHEMWQVAKSIDPTRLIEDMSVVVWEHLVAYGHVDTDINSWHFYLDDYARAKAHIEDVVAKTYRGSTFNFVTGHEQRDAPLINSEYGGVGALDGDRDISWTFKFLTNELRRHEQLSAYVFTQLTDVEWEYNGLLNYDRTPKQLGYPANVVNQGDVLPINSPPISRVAPGSSTEIEILSSHFSRRTRAGVTLHWHYAGIDTLGTYHPQLLRGWMPIPFTQNRVEAVHRLPLTFPLEPMLGTLSVAAVGESGETIAVNFIQHLVAAGAAREREEHGLDLVLRRHVDDWTAAEWSEEHCPREEAARLGKCFGRGAGYFEWEFKNEALQRLDRALRLRVLCEASACRPGHPQTDAFAFPTVCTASLNGLPVHHAVLPNHPHDSRGVLSYLDGNTGAYGYLMKAVIEDDFLRSVAATAAVTGTLRFRCEVPAEAEAAGGLTVYGESTGRYPICPTLVVEWDRARKNF